MARLFELFLIALIVYLALRRLTLPIRRGYNERERERQQERQAFRGWTSKRPEQIDRTNAKDAEFKDLS